MCCNVRTGVASDFAPLKKCVGMQNMTGGAVKFCNPLIIFCTPKVMLYNRYTFACGYIQQKTYPQDSSKVAKNAIRRRAKQFRVVKNTLYYVQSSKVTGEPNLRQVVTSKEQQKKIIQQCHVVNGVDGHFGIRKTLSTVQGRFYWKGMVDDVTSYVKVCDPCHRENPQLMKTPATLHPIPVTASFWHQVGQRQYH